MTASADNAWAMSTLASTDGPALHPGIACSGCDLRGLCLPGGFSEEETTRLDGLVSDRLNVRRGETLYRTGRPFLALFAVRSGSFKTRTSSRDGHEHVSGFQMTGEILGLDGLGFDEHTCDAVALEDSRVCVLPYEKLDRLCRKFGELRRQLHRIMGREIVRDHRMMVVLGRMNAAGRLAAFLLDLSARSSARGASPTELVLRMTREEIGSHLGLELETISRSLSHLQGDGVLLVRRKCVLILDPARLQALVEKSAR